MYNDTNDAKSALNAGQIDGIVVDLPTAYYITAVEMPKAKIVGQFEATADGEQFGLLFAKGNPGDLRQQGPRRALGQREAEGDPGPVARRRHGALLPAVARSAGTAAP
ncbi:MAG: hypothetical protein U0R65_13900 [Candidatus Nanopelagicales bacterium]